MGQKCATLVDSLPPLGTLVAWLMTTTLLAMLQASEHATEEWY